MKQLALRTSLAAFALALGLQTLPGPALAQHAGLPDFTELVEKVGPAVVNIRTAERVRSAQGPELDAQMLEFLRRYGIPMPRRQGPRGGDEDEGPQRRGVGSGFVLGADGVVLTNAHVVDGADEVIVTLTDKREFKAKVLGTDRRTDVAVLKIEATGLPTVKLGEVGKLKVGEWVLAIGSPFGFDNTVTAGIVSAKARDTGDFLPFIQTDVAINPGNSGGPLLNMRGEVVGINSQIYSQSGGFMGISFAIPIDEAMRVADQLRTSGRVVRGRIGVGIDAVSREVAEAIGLQRAFGALVRNVEAGGPAEKAGIEGGDVITKFDGKSIERSTDLPRLVGAVRPGSKASLQVFRRGAFKDLQVVVAELKEGNPRGTPEAGEGPRVGSAFGLSLSDLTEAQRKEMRLRNGVRVDGAEGAAARAGLREGDVILSVDNAEVNSARQLQTLLGKLEKAKVVSLVVRRGDVTSIVLIRPSR
ncbi:DegQ family serine endoprotease [Inhella proteolytica]|uniref:Probable periplasmic serine endoprotease DegP-like n=1 Tax=Inhella proteolytica TaxID=2795029 RepID=A0A931NIV6_9BURK|nr:DegQ family serine endoprotease [Inhella proteolytica]MBH9577985.1 DegQ family serine endoprotease [Inhella proteolytica]